MKCENCIHANVCDLSDIQPDEEIVCSGYEEPRPHGEWTWKEWVTPTNKISYCKCSVCGIGMGNTEWDFCPNCGADMRRKEGEPE